MNRFLVLVTGLVALGFGSGQGLAQPTITSTAMPTQLSALDEQIQNDYAAIARDKAAMDRDQGVPTAWAKDRHQLFVDTEMQEDHRGTYERVEDKGKW